MRNYFYLILIILVAFISINAREADNETKTYQVSRKLRFKNIYSTSDQFIIYLPLPLTNSSQYVSNYNVHGGEIISNPGTKDNYARYILDGNQIPAINNWGEVSFDFDYIPKDSRVDINSIEKVFPYDTTSSIYKMYTIKKYEFIDPENEVIKTIGETLWKNSKNLLEYIKQCFDYVHQNFAYKNPGTGFHRISYLISNGGGDCGNLSSLFISLLRYKKIPARHVITSGHVWAEFYLEKYEWIPADETFGLYGKAPTGWGIVWSDEIVFNLKTSSGNTFYVEDLGQIHLFYPSHAPFKCDDTITTTEIESTSKTQEESLKEMPANYLYQNYPNPFNPSTVIGYKPPVNNNLKICDVLGKELRTLVDSFQSAGEHSIAWNAACETNYPFCSGIYFYKMESNGLSFQKKMVLVR